jgi:hypothetical protein
VSEYAISVDEAVERLVIQPDYDPGDGPQPGVHTFRSAPFGLLGAHWSVESARAAMERHGVEEAGEQARQMGHGLVVIDSTGPVFFEARDPS